MFEVLSIIGVVVGIASAAVLVAASYRYSSLLREVENTEGEYELFERSETPGPRDHV